MRDPYYARMRLVVLSGILIAAMFIQPYAMVRTVVLYVGGIGGYYLLWKRFQRRRAARSPAPSA
jgi:hypothetical protein